ncbi:MAG: hypothetical protein VW338_14540 [Rhodospirillaceae bacterium]
MNTNRVTVDAPEQITAALSVEELAMLLDDIAGIEATAKKAKAAVRAAVIEKFAIDKNAMGSQTIDAEGFKVKVTIPKTVEWDQAHLLANEGIVRSWNSDPAEYIDVKRSVSETKFNAWPSEVRVLFEPARTVKPGTASVKIERAN